MFETDRPAPLCPQPSRLFLGLFAALALVATLLLPMFKAYYSRVADLNIFQFGDLLTNAPPPPPARAPWPGLTMQVTAWIAWGAPLLVVLLLSWRRTVSGLGAVLHRSRVALCILQYPFLVACWLWLAGRWRAPGIGIVEFGPSLLCLTAAQLLVTAAVSLPPTETK